MHNVDLMLESIFSKEYSTVIKYVDDGYDGKGWNHSDPKLGDIYWTIEEASWLRSTYDKEKLKSDCLLFIKFLEEKYNLHTSEKIIQDLINFQIFLLTTREDYSKTKSFEFLYNWKEFFVENLELTDCKTMYSYPNQNVETDPIEWAYKTIWFGRYSTKYKFHPEFLEEIPHRIQLN